MEVSCLCKSQSRGSVNGIPVDLVGEFGDRRTMSCCVPKRNLELEADCESPGLRLVLVEVE